MLPRQYVAVFWQPCRTKFRPLDKVLIEHVQLVSTSSKESFHFVVFDNVASIDIVAGVDVGLYAASKSVFWWDICIFFSVDYSQNYGRRLQYCMEITGVAVPGRDVTRSAPGSDGDGRSNHCRHPCWWLLDSPVSSWLFRQQHRLLCRLTGKRYYHLLINQSIDRSISQSIGLSLFATDCAENIFFSSDYMDSHVFHFSLSIVLTSIYSD